MKCHKCGKPVFFAERRTSLGYEWHPECLRCEECGKRLNPGQHAEHKGVPYCHIPCYSVLFGPTLFGHGSQVEAHTSFGKAVNRQGTPVPRTHLEAKLRIYNNFFDGKSGTIQSRERNGRLILEGPIRIFWGVSNVIHLKEDHDDRIPVRRRNSYCPVNTEQPQDKPDPSSDLTDNEKSALIEKDPNLLNSLLSLPMNDALPLSDIDLDVQTTEKEDAEENVVSPTHYKTLPAGGLRSVKADNNHSLMIKADSNHSLTIKADNNHSLTANKTDGNNSMTLKADIINHSMTLKADNNHSMTLKADNNHSLTATKADGNNGMTLKADNNHSLTETKADENHSLTQTKADDKHSLMEIKADDNNGLMTIKADNNHGLTTNDRCGNVVQLRRRPRVQKSKLKRRCSINGHYYNRETSVFTPAFASITSVWVTSLVTAPEVINMLLDKFKVVNNPEDFALFVVRDTGERRCIQENEYPLLVRVMLGPSEEVAKVFIMNKYLAKEITCEVAQYIKFTDTELKMFLHKFNEEEKKEEQRIARKYQEKKARIQARIDELKEVQQTGL